MAIHYVFYVIVRNVVYSAITAEKHACYVIGTTTNRRYITVMNSEIVSLEYLDSIAKGGVGGTEVAESITDSVAGSSSNFAIQVVIVCSAKHEDSRSAIINAEVQIAVVVVCSALGSRGYPSTMAWICGLHYSGQI
jgi:hypothetical protein